MKTRHPLQIGILALLAVLGSLTVGESLWWNNARASYPMFLVGEAPDGAHDPLTLAKACGQPVEVEPDGADMALVRCGTFWPARSVWPVPKTYVAPTLK